MASFEQKLRTLRLMELLVRIDPLVVRIFVHLICL